MGVAQFPGCQWSPGFLDFQDWGSRTKPSFTTVPGNGVTQDVYITVFEDIKKNFPSWKESLILSRTFFSLSQLVSLSLKSIFTAVFPRCLARSDEEDCIASTVATRFPLVDDPMCSMGVPWMPWVFLQIDLMNKNVGILEHIENTKGKTQQKQEAPQKWYSVRLFFLFFSIIYAILAYFKSNHVKHHRLSRHRQGSIKGHFAFSQQALQWVQRFQRHFARRKNARTVGLEKQRGDLWRRCFWLRFKSGWMVARWGLLGSDGKIRVAVDPGNSLFFFGGSASYMKENFISHKDPVSEAGFLGNDHKDFVSTAHLN